MSLKDKLQKAWANRSQIAEGFYNAYISSDQEIKEEAQRRWEECKKCEYYDPEGKGEIIVVRNEPGCLLCGCNTKMMVHSMSKQCSIVRLGLKSRWDALIPPEAEQEVNQQIYNKQFEKK